MAVGNSFGIFVVIVQLLLVHRTSHANFFTVLLNLQLAVTSDKGAIVDPLVSISGSSFKISVADEEISAFLKNSNFTLLVLKTQVNLGQCLKLSPGLGFPIVKVQLLVSLNLFFNTFLAWKKYSTFPDVKPFKFPLVYPLGW